MNIHQSTPDLNHNSVIQPELSTSEFAGRPLYRELMKVDICASISIKNSRNSSKKFFGNVESIRNSLDIYDIPKIIGNKPIAISLLVKDLANSPQHKRAISEITQILNFHLFERIRLQLPKFPSQLLTTQFSAAILCIRHDSLLEILEEGEISFERVDNIKCIRSIDLYKYMKNLEKIREGVLAELFQSGY